jgi:hypothetical protein
VQHRSVQAVALLQVSGPDPARQSAVRDTSALCQTDVDTEEVALAFDELTER